MRSLALILLALFSVFQVSAQVTISDPYLRIAAGGDDPLFTTYAASMERSRFFADKSYFMDYFSSDRPITYTSQYAGDVAAVWKVDNVVVSTIAEFYQRPVVVASFPD